MRITPRAPKSKPISATKKRFAPYTSSASSRTIGCSGSRPVSRADRRGRAFGGRPAAPPLSSRVHRLLPGVVGAACFLNLQASASSSRFLDRDWIHGDGELSGVAWRERSRPFHGVPPATGVEGSCFFTMFVGWRKEKEKKGIDCWRGWSLE